MRIVHRSPDSITPYPGNPRCNDAAVDAVAASIKAFGFRQPIVVDADGVIIVGHTRWKAAKKIGLKKVPVHVATDLSPEQQRAYRIADNQTASLAEWDYDRLIAELTELGNGEFDLSLLGFGEKELAQLLHSGLADGLTDPDAVPETPDEAVTQPGDLYILGDHRLLCGDSTLPEAIARVAADAERRMCFPDPPWNVAIGGDGNPRHRQRKGLENDDLSDADYTAFLSAFIRNLRGAVTGDVYCVLGAAQWPTLDACLRAEGYHWSATVIWVKDIFVLGRSKYHRRYEPIWYGWHGSGKSSFAGDRKQDDVWEFARPRRSEEHPTMKPVELVARAIENSSQAGDLVFDPFVGSGTTIIACEQLGRGRRAVEIAPRYCDVVVRRWEEFTGRKAERAGKHKRTPASRKKAGVRKRPKKI